MFGDNWSRHHESFLKCCKEWSVQETKYPDYLKEILSDEALNFAGRLTETDPDISLDRISTLTAVRYVNINLQKEVSDRLN